MEEENKEREELGEAPKKEVRVWGGGVVLKKMDKLIELQDRNNFLLAMTEKKIEKSNEALEKLSEVLEKHLNTLNH